MHLSICLHHSYVMGNLFCLYVSLLYLLDGLWFRTVNPAETQMLFSSIPWYGQVSLLMVSPACFSLSRLTLYLLLFVGGCRRTCHTTTGRPVSSWSPTCSCAGTAWWPPGSGSPRPPGGSATGSAPRYHSY